MTEIKENILILEGRRSIGGGQVMTRHICSALSDSSNLIVFLPDGQSEIREYLSEYKQYHYPLLEYKRGKKKIKDVLKFILNFVSIYKSLRRCVIEHKISTLYVQTSLLIPVVVVFARLHNIEVIAHLHVFHIDRKSRMILNLFLYSKMVTKIIGVSNYALSQLNEVNKQKSVVIYNCVNKLNVTSEPFHSDNRKSISIVGDVIEHKGQHVLLNVIDELPYEIEVNIIGSIVDIEYSNKLSKISKKQKVNIVGCVDNINHYLSNTDVLIVASLLKNETFSLAMVEAWAMRVPTIASDFGGMKELVETFLPQFADNMLFELGNSLELKQKLENLLANRDEYLQISEAVELVYSHNFTKQRFAYFIKKAMVNS